MRSTLGFLGRRGRASDHGERGGLDHLPDIVPAVGRGFRLLHGGFLEVADASEEAEERVMMEIKFDSTKGRTLQETGRKVQLLTKRCTCGRIISANKESCLDCLRVPASKAPVPPAAA